MRNRQTVLTLAAVLLLASVASTQQPVTLEALLSPPFPSEIAAAPTGGRVAWVQNAKGSRNVWIASPPEFAARQLTLYAGDDGQDITTLTWTADGRTVLYVRGGSPNRQGEIPNPAQLIDGAEQAIWAVDASATTAPRKLAAGNSPVVSPTGEVAFLVRSQIWHDQHRRRRAGPLALHHRRGQARDLRWSPDGNRLAFVSSRGDHSFIGVYDRAAKSLRYLDPSIDLGCQPDMVARRHAHRVHPHACHPARSSCSRRAAKALPWSIRVAMSATRPRHRGLEGAARRGQRVPGGQCRARSCSGLPATASSSPGSATAGSTCTPCRSPVARRRLLTPGDFEVEHVALTPDRARVIYSSNQDDIDRRHIWSVAVRRRSAGGAHPRKRRRMDASADRRRRRWHSYGRMAACPPTLRFCASGEVRALAPQTIAGGLSGRAARRAASA